MIFFGVISVRLTEHRRGWGVGGVYSSLLRFLNYFLHFPRPYMHYSLLSMRLHQREEYIGNGLAL